MITLFKKSQKIVFNIQSQLYNTILTTTVPGYNMALLEWVMPLQFAHIKKNQFRGYKKRQFNIQALNI